MMVPPDLSLFYSLSLMSLGVTLIAIGIAYALGQALQNPNFSVWAKTEVYQVFVSFVIVVLVLFMVGLLYSVKYGDVRSLSPIDVPAYEKPGIAADDSVFDASEKYLYNVGNVVYVEMRASRGLYGALDVLSRYRRTPCVPAIFLCLYGPNGYSMATDIAASSWIQGVNMSLYTDTISYLTVLVQLAFLRFIQSGGFLILLPLAIVFRSLPFFRQMGGGLMAIIIALFIIYPSLLFLESFFWNPHAMLGGEYDTLGNFGSDMDGDRVIAGVFENGLPDNYDEYSEVREMVRVQSKGAAVAFLSSTFLFSLNIIAVGASARELGRLLGQETDLSRLMQIV